MLLLASENALSQNKELRLCDLALGKCGQALEMAEQHIQDKSDTIKLQNQLIRAAGKVVVNQDVQIQEHKSHMKKLPYYLLGAFMLGVYSGSKL